MLAYERARHAVVEEDAHIEVIVEVNGKSEPSFFDKRQLAARDVCAFARAAVSLLAVLRASARLYAGLGVHVLRQHVENARGDGEDVEHACLRECVVDGLGRGIFSDDEPTLGLARRRGLGALEKVDRRRVVGQVGIVNAVAAHAFATRPFATGSRIFAQTIGELS